jgi:hypothetical protein
MSHRVQESFKRTPVRKLGLVIAMLSQQEQKYFSKSSFMGKDQVRDSRRLNRMGKERPYCSIALAPNPRI